MPSRSNKVWQGQSYGDDVISIATNDSNACLVSCSYNIAVVPWGVIQSTPVSYSITVTQSSTIVLRDAVQVRDVVALGGVRYYEFSPPANITSVSFVISPSSGGVSSYVTTVFNQSLSPSSLSLWSANSSSPGEQTILVTPQQSWFCGLLSQQTKGSQAGVYCRYRVAVVGTSSLSGADIAYSIRATSTGSPSTPTNPNSTVFVALSNVVQASTFSGLQGSTAYYYLQLALPSQLTFTLTSLTGDADLFYLYSPSATYQYPSAMRNNGSSVSSSAVDTILVPYAAAGWYFLAVQAFTDCSYRLLASIYNTTVLSDGQPQSGVVSEGGVVFYNFTLSSATPRLTISLFRQVGDPDLYVSLNAFPDRNATWSSVLTGSDLISINAPQPGVYVIGVFGFSLSLFTLTASTQNSNTQLSMGRPVSGSLNRSESDYYVLTQSANTSVVVTVTVFTGDCDLFMSNVTTQPNTAAASQYSAQSYGQDSITVPAAIASTVWYIGVYAFQACIYSLSASQGAASLQDGLPQSGNVSLNQYNLYNFTIDASAQYTLTVAATSTAGSVQLFVVSSTSATPYPPSLTSSDWSSPAYLSSPSIIISPASSAYCSIGLCIYSIAVLGTGQNGGLYSLVVSSNRSSSLSQLQDGVSSSGYLTPGSYSYYSFPNVYALAATLITVQPNAADSDPDLFLSTNNSRPSASSFQVRGLQAGADALYVDPTSPYYSSLYFISVYAAAGFPCYYTILARNVNITATGSLQRIVANSEQTGLVSTSSSNLLSQYYLYDVQVLRNSSGFSQEDVTLTLTAQYGDPDMYVIVATSDPSVLPSLSNALFRSTDIAGGVIIIPAAQVCHPACSYLIAVTAYTSSLYSLLISTGPQIIPLRAGIPYTSQVSALGSVNFALYVDHSDELTITVTSITGDADIYVNFTAGSQPLTVTTARGSYRWSSIDFGTDLVSIGTSEIGTYYILVYGYYAATFTITATLGATNLLPGQPQQDYISYGDYKLYVVNYGEPEQYTPLSFVVKPSAGFPYVNMYASTTAYPAPGSYTWASLYMTGNAYVNNLTIPACGNGSAAQLSCVQYLTKYYVRVDAVGNTAYDITAYYGPIPVVLSQGRPTSDVVQAGSCNSYRAFISKPAPGLPVPDVSIDATEQYGDVQLYVGFYSNVSQQSGSYYATSGADLLTRSAHLGLDMSALNPTFNDANLFTLYIAVCGLAQSSLYSLTFSTSATLLPLNQPQAATSQGGIKPVYFFVQAQLASLQLGYSGNLSIILSGDLADGGDDFLNTTTYNLYACNTVNVGVQHCNGQLPSNSLFDYASGPVTNNQPWVLPPPLEPSLTSGTYFIAVYTVSSVNFTITATQRGLNSSQTVTQALLGETVSSRVNPEYYSASVNSSSTAIVVLDVCQGSGAVYLSSFIVYPTPQFGYDLAVALPGNTSSIPAPGPGSVYFAVMPSLEGQLLQYDLNVYANVVPPNLYLQGDRALTAADNGDGFDITFSTATANPPFSAGSIVLYNVYWSLASSNINVFTACGCALLRTSISSSDPTSGFLAAGVSEPSSAQTQSSYSLHGLPRGTYKINIVASLQSSLFQPSSQVAFTSVGQGLTVYTSGNNYSPGTSSAVMAAIAVPIVLLVVAALVYLCYRSCRVQAAQDGIAIGDVPRAQIEKAMSGIGFRARAARRLAKPGRSRYTNLGSGQSRYGDGGTEISMEGLGLGDDDEEDLDHDNGLRDSELYDGEEAGTGGAAAAGRGGRAEQEERKSHVYTLDTAIDAINEEDEREDSLGLRS